MMFKSEFLKILDERGFISAITSAELDKACEKPITLYIGFDCTAKSLHVGSLIQIMLLRWAQKCGHKVIVLLGGGTTKIGDPSGKDKSRQLLNEEDILANMNGIKSLFDVVLDEKPVFVNNDDWLCKLNFLDFLREVGSQFTINKMLSMDSVKSRLEREQSLSFLEFNYMILQAFDFAELNSRFQCSLQMGGSDQWGNIVNGIELTKRLNNCQVFGLTTPLMVNSNGEKMGKTANGAVWLDEESLSNSDFWQFWRNVSDEDVIRFLKLFTELPLNEIEQLSFGDINQAKIVLADSVTQLVRKTKAQIPEVKVTNTNLVDILVETKIAPSKTRAWAFIKNNGVRINDEKVSDNIVINNNDKISFGKKKHIKIIM